MTRGRSVGGAEMTGAEVTGAEVTGAEMVWGRSVCKSFLQDYIHGIKGKDISSPLYSCY